MLTLSYSPRAPLNRFVERLWLVLHGDCVRQECILPSGTVELVVNLRDDRVRIEGTAHGAPGTTLSGAAVSGPYSEAFIVFRHLLVGVIVMSTPISSQQSQPQGRSADAAAAVTVRYIVKDVPGSVEFYTKHLGFTIALDARPAFAVVAHGALRLALSGMGGQGGGAQPMPDGRKPEPGGWNRIQIVVSDLASEVTRLRAANATFRNDIVKGNGGLQILLEDPSGNPVELFQPY